MSFWHWHHQHKLFKEAITLNDPTSFLNEHKHEIDVDIFGKYCIDNNMKLFQYIDLFPVKHSNLSSWLSYAIQIDKQDIVKYLSDSIESIIDSYVCNNSIKPLRQILKFHPVTVIRSCIKHNKPIIFDSNDEYHHFVIVMFALFDNKYDLVRHHLLNINDDDHIANIEHIVDYMRSKLNNIE